MKSVRWLAIVFLVMVLVQPVLADFSVAVEEINADIYRDQTAEYEVTVRNFGSDDAQFQVYTIDPAWVVKTIPLKLFVPAGGEDILVLTIRPTLTADYGGQGVPITFKDLVSGDIIQQSVVVNLRNENLPDREYAATVAIENVLMDFEVDPREGTPLRVELRNRNRRDLRNVSVTVSATHFSRTATLDLPPFSVQTRDFGQIAIDPLTPPGDAEVVIKIHFQGEQLDQLTKNYKIAEYSEIREDITEETVFFKKNKDITVHNQGNVQNTAIVTVPTSIIKVLFVSSDIPYERVDDTLVWRVPLEPNETMTFRYTENYRILILLLLVAIFGGIAYFFLRSPVILVKEAVGMTKKGEGVSRIKVRVFVKNRSARLVRDLQITDKLPSLADVIKAEAPGSITPSKIAVSEKSGTLLKWHLDVLEPYEERVLTYQAKSKLKIIGRMSLPNAKARFSVGGKDRVVFSNNIEIVEKFRNK